MKFRFRYQVAGGHTHVRFFAGTGDTLGKCGDLVFRNEEWRLFNQVLKGVSHPDVSLQVVPEDQEVPK